MTIKEQFYKHISLVDEQLNFSSFAGQSLTSFFTPFIDSMTPDGAISYLLDKPQRYRASPLASSMIWMEKAKLLSPEVSQKLADKLFFLRDYSEPDDAKVGESKKESEDSSGWSLSEGVSVWSTSLAIIAILQSTNHTIVSHQNEIKNTIIWLIDQQDLHESGWAYQNNSNCDVNAVTTSLAMYAIALSLSEKDLLQFNDTDCEKITRSLSNGTEYLKKQFGNKNYCCFNKAPNCFATIWALLALELISKTDLDNIEAASLLKGKKDSSLKYIVKRIPKSNGWADEQIVQESGAKYSAQKNYYSFSPSLIPLLIDLGVSPSSPKIVNQIILLINNDKNWTVTKYSKDGICSFTYAMSISTVVFWLKKVGFSYSKNLTERKQTIISKLSKFIYGYNNISEEPIRFINKNRIYALLLLACSVIVFAILKKPVALLLSNIFTYFFADESNTQGVIINIIANFLWLPIMGILKLIINGVKLILKKVQIKKWE